MACESCDSCEFECEPHSPLVEPTARSFRVRSRPPSYFAFDSSWRAAQAEREYDSFRNAQKAEAGFKQRVRAAVVLVRHGYTEYNAQSQVHGFYIDVDIDR